MGYPSGAPAPEFSSLLRCGREPVRPDVLAYEDPVARAGNIAAQDTVAETRGQSSGFFVDSASVILTNRQN